MQPVGLGPDHMQANAATLPKWQGNDMSPHAPTCVVSCACL